MDTNLPTITLLSNLSNFLTSLGFKKVSIKERWESDGVYVVSTELTRKVSPGCGWYLVVTGNDNEWIDDPGVDFIHASDKGEKSHTTYAVASYDQLKELLIQTNFMP